MNKQSRFNASTPLTGNLAGAVSHRAAPATLHTADASKVSGRAFLDAIGLSSPEAREARREQSRQRCIRAIERGDTYGFPPSLVDECRQIIADEDRGWALAERSAYGMPGVGK
jgi:hypothetical protein